MMLTGAEILVRCLIEENVDYVFGYPGGAVLNIYDELFKQQDNIQHILTRHEQAAVHAADGYARSTNKVGVALVTSGPGATNAVTGIATAYMDSAPIVVISGQVPSSLIGSDAFQEVDAVGVTRPCVKHNFLVKNIEDLAPTIKKAFYLASTGRPGPVHIDIAKDVTIAQHEFQYPEKISMRSYNPTVRGHPGQIRRAVQAIQAAKRPVVYFGGGVILSDASKELTDFIEMLNLPATATLMGIGAFSADKPQYLGMVGMHGTYEANMAMHYSDLIIAVGARFDDRVIGNIPNFEQQSHEIIHIDVDPSSISKNVKASIPVVGDAKTVLAEFIRQIKASDEPHIDSEALGAWWHQINEWRKVDSLQYNENTSTLKPQYVIERVAHYFPDAIITTDVGQHQMWAAQYFPFKEPKKWITSGGLGTMGFGLPAAIGAKLANPDKPVVCITSEGSIQMNIQELGTSQQYNIPLIVVSLNNGYLGMVRQWQTMFYGDRLSETTLDVQPDFIKLVEAYGHEGIRVNNREELDATLEKAKSHTNGILFLDVIVDRNEDVLPMIPAGKGLAEMTLRNIDEEAN